MKRTVAHLLATCFGIGHAPVAPGTVASFASLLIYQLVPTLQQPLVLLPLVILLTVAGIWAGSVMEELFGNDPSIVVIDEWVGQWLALLLIPHGWIPALLAFGFFRLFDIAKPWIIDRAQRLPHGWGIMADDVLAGIAANVSVQLLMVGAAML